MLFKNTLAQSTTLITGYLFSIVLAPLLLARLGLDQFGVWAVTGALAGYAGLVDFGVSRAIGRYVALYDAQLDINGVRETFTMGMLVNAAVTVFTFILAVAIAPLAADGLGVLDTGEMRIVLLCSAALLALQSYRRVLNAVPVGLRQMVPPNITNVIGNVVNFSFSVGILLLSTDLVDYALANVAADTIGLTISYFFGLRRVWQTGLLRWPRGQRAREIFDYAAKSQVHFLSWMVNIETDKLLVAAFIDVRAAGAFELAGRVVSSVKAVGVLSISAILPTATARIAEQGRGVITEMYQYYTRRAVSVAYPVFIVTCVAAPPLLVAWLGEVPSQTAMIVIVLSLGWFANVSIEIGMNLTNADGRPGAVGTNSAIMAGMHLVFALALAPAFGMWGIVIGATIATLLGTALFVRNFHRHYNLPVSVFLRAAVPPGLLALGCAAPLTLVYLVADPTPPDRWSALPLVIVIGGAYTMIYWVAASRLGYLPGKLTLPIGRRREQPATA